MKRLFLYIMSEYPKENTQPRFCVNSVFSDQATFTLLGFAWSGFGEKPHKELKEVNPYFYGQKYPSSDALPAPEIFTTTVNWEIYCDVPV